ncbi:MAG: anti-sigma factor family protein [Anaerolineae bacterium]
MKCDRNRLLAYRDGALATDEQAALEEHLSGCAACRQELALLRQRGAEVAHHLVALDPQPHETPDAAQALARFQRTVAEAATSKRETTTLKGRVNMAKQTIMSPRWRPASIAVTALILVAILFSFAPVREAAADFLGVFRVRKFAVIPVDLAQLERLEDVANLVEATLGRPTFLREPGAPQTVADAQEASALAGFQVRVPAALPEGAHLQEFSVATGPAVRLEVPLSTAQALLETLDLQDVALPKAETLVAEADFFPIVHQEYRIGTGTLTILQTPSPSASLTPEADPTVLGEAVLRLMGLPAEEARRLAQTIDWTSTLVVPLPTDVARFREVDVGGVTGLWLEEKVQGQGSARSRTVLVLWQRDGVIYVVTGQNLQDSLVLQVADSLR